MNSSAESAPEPAAAAATPDYLLNPDAVLGDSSTTWCYARAPDYSKLAKFTKNATKTQNHAAASLPNLVENLVKSWEVEASFKPNLQDWRTVDHANYSFAIKGGPPQTAEHMLKVGTYNVIIAPNEYYEPTNMDFNQSHKTFKRMMPTFAWEVIGVYSGPPVVAFKWRYWGTMKNDYVGNNNKGEKVRVEAHGGAIDIRGVTVAKVNHEVQLQSVETWFDPMEMFRQIVGGRGEEGISRGDATPTTDSDSESEMVLKTTPAGDVEVSQPTEETIAAKGKETALEEKLEEKVGVDLDVEDSEEQAARVAKVDEMKREAEKEEEETKPDIKQLAGQIKVLAEQIAKLQSSFERLLSSSPELTWEKVERGEKNEISEQIHGCGSLASGTASGTECPFMP